MDTKIQRVHGCEVLDSRGNPTVMAEVTLACGASAFAMAPSGASTGSHEAHELRDGGSRYGGKGVLGAVCGVEGDLAASVIGVDACDQRRVDALLCAADGTKNKARLGANAILAVSLAAAKAAAAAQGIPLFRHISRMHGGLPRLPVPMMNILNGGAHAANTVDIQEFMIIPQNAREFPEGVRRCCEIYHALGRILRERKFSTGVGDEGGYAPNLAADEEAIRVILRAAEKAGCEPGRDVALGLDAAASEWRMEQGAYLLPKSSKLYSRDQLVELWSALVEKYPIVSIEDPFSEDDWQSWSKLTAKLGGSCRIVGDDLFVTDKKRILRGVEEHSATAALIKPNQIGTLSETLEAVRAAQDNGLAVVVSHRSGETEDSAIADIAVGVGAGWIKAGAPARGERTAKYNRLLVISQQISGS